jgi:polysaccharide chain length determinant protein (PEP-CTERM system associated)
VVGIFVAAGVALSLPPVYSASTTILIEPPGIPDQLVRSTVVQDKESRFHNIRLRILSRDNLSSVIDDLGLFSQETGVAREKLVNRMRKQIDIAPILPDVVDPRRELEINSLRITYRSDDPKLAAEAANRLARDFIRQNLAERASDAEGTSDFILAELRREQAQVAQAAQAIQDFKEENLGSLPEQLETSRRTLERLYIELNDKKTELEFARNQSNMVRQQIAEYRRTFGGVTSNNADTNPMIRKSELELQLSVMRSRGYTDRHPDIRRTQAEIATMSEMVARNAVEAEEPVPEEEIPLTPYETRMLEDLRNFEVNLTVRGQETERLTEEIAKYEARIEQTPAVAARLGSLLERHDAGQASIKLLQQKLHTADIAKSMETKQKGEKFRVIESAEPPEAPQSPNRPLIFVVGVVLGFFGGIALVVLREVGDQRLYTLSELDNALDLPVLASVSRIRLPVEIAEARARFRRVGLVSAVGAMLLIGGAAAFYFATNGPAPLPQAAPEAAPETEGDV